MGVFSSRSWVATEAWRSSKAFFNFFLWSLRWYFQVQQAQSPKSAREFRESGFSQVNPSSVIATLYYLIVNNLPASYYIPLIQIAWNKIGQFLSDLRVGCQRWMYTVSSAFYSQSIHQIAELNFQFILRFGLQAGDNRGKFQAQCFILCVLVWERRLGRGEKNIQPEKSNLKLEGTTDLFYLPLARRTEAILQTF